MKRLIIILIMIIPLRIKANEKIYTDYILSEKTVETYKEETEYLKREEETLYNTYTLEKIDEGYQIPNETNKHLYKDENDHIEETYFTQEKIDDNQIQYSYTKVGSNFGVNEVFIQDITQNGPIDDKIEYFRIYDKETLILDINHVDTTGTDKHNIKQYFFPKTNILDIRIEIKYKDDTVHTEFEGWLRFYGSLAGMTNTFYLNKTKSNNIIVQQYLLEEDYNKISQEITWDHYTPWNYVSKVGYKKTEIKYHYYSYKKTYLNTYTNIESDDYNIDYKDSKTYYNYYQRYYYILSDKIDTNNIKNIILDTNANKDNIDITYKENDNNYIATIEYLDTKIYKIYQKEPQKTQKQTQTTTSVKVVNLSSPKQTTKKIEPQQTKETNKINYTYMISLLPLVILYIIYYHKKK